MANQVAPYISVEGLRMIRGFPPEVFERVLLELETAFDAGVEAGKKAAYVAAVMDGHAGGLTPQVFSQVCQLIQQKRRIDAIKLIREVTKEPLKDAKERMERIEAVLKAELSNE